MTNDFRILDADFLHKDTVVSFFNPMFKVGELTSFLNEIFRDLGLRELSSRLNNCGKG